MLPILIALPVLDPSSNRGVKGSLVTTFVLVGLGGSALLAIAFLQRASGLRIYEEGVVYQRFWGKRIINWLRVRDVYQQHAGGYESGEYQVSDKFWWTLHLEDGTRYDFYDTFYDSNEYLETMVAMVAEFKRFREAWSMKYGPV
jgi:hypothetical protein